ncbi:pilus assembly FimT family protein [Peptostreptococcus sp. D1]|uniref:pilus assembly FimT family protein n=1 Tax=Peptostreptococcus sp. D1 TaxID=72304 RepID=UPI0008E16339|nr:hypothetical protein [Peptostreptococcus sp. D1]SFE74419.1 hypothetical protein SAMN02910278_01587 [Peptostreptococcus sp. D1]
MKNVFDDNIRKDIVKNVKREGFSTLEIMVAVSLIALIFSIAYLGINFNDKEFQTAVFETKSDLREYLIKSSDEYYKYSILLVKNGYEIYQKNNLVREKKFPQNIYILSGEKSIGYYSTSRFGAPNRGFTIYVFDERNKNLERITMMLGSGRVISYEEDYLEKKSLIDGLISRL